MSSFVESEVSRMLNTPIDVIAFCNTEGDLVPLRIRLEDEERSICVFKIKEVLYCNKHRFCGIPTLDYGCKIEMNGMERIFELRYNLDTRRWTISRKIL